jgi:hypothetical protein
MTDQWTDRLSEYLDDEGDLTAAERRDLEGHLTACADCRGTLEELRGVVAQAGALASRGPETDLWPGIALRIAPMTRRYSFSMPQLVAAGLALMVVTGSAVWMARREATQPVATGASNDERFGPSVLPVDLADAPYEKAVGDLERTLEAGRARLDPATIEVLEDSLTAIDQAIEQSQRALAADPANTYLYNHLADARKRKLALLRRASAITNPEG